MTKRLLLIISLLGAEPNMQVETYPFFPNMRKKVPFIMMRMGNASPICSVT